MSSPPPGGEMPYQPSPSPCHCFEKTLEPIEPPTHPQLCPSHLAKIHHAHHHHGHAPPNQTHVHVHAPPKQRDTPPVTQCNCHLSVNSDTEVIQEVNVVRERKLDDDSIEVSPLPPALPPRPPPRPRTEGLGTLNNRRRLGKSF